MYKLKDILEIKIIPGLKLDYSDFSVYGVEATKEMFLDGEGIIRDGYYLELLNLGKYYALIPAGGSIDAYLIPKEFVKVKYPNVEYSDDSMDNIKASLIYLKNLIQQGKFKILTSK